MKKLTIIIVILAIAINSYSQSVSRNNYTGQWNIPASWSQNAPNDFNINENRDYTINGYITIGTPSTDQDLTFSNTGQNEDFTIADTLVVFGDVIHANKGHNIVINSNAIFIVFGNFTADNKISIASGGKFIVTGNLSFSNSPQDDYSGNGDLYVFGSTSGNTDASNAAKDNSEFNNNEDPALVSFVNSRGFNSLPIDLKSFNSKILDNSVYLDWTTSKEENFSHFEVERKLGEGEYETIGFVQGMGESLSDVSYNYTDYDLSYGNIYYRLKAVDIDGQFEYSPIKKVEISLNGQTSVYPNPTRSIENVKITLPRTLDGTIARVALYDLNGAMLEEKFDFDANEALSFNITLKQGMYILKIQHNGTEDNVRVMIQ